MSLKQELEKLISQLKLNTPETLLSDDPLTEQNWNKVCQSVKLLVEAVKHIEHLPPDVPPAGSPYFRLPGMPVPWEQHPCTTKEQWTAIHSLYPGDFMRLAGGNASKFKEDSAYISYDSKAKGDGGGQTDSLQEHKHPYHYKECKSHGGLRGDISRYMYQELGRDVKTGNCEGARTDIETRSKNITIELYIFKG